MKRFGMLLLFVGLLFTAFLKRNVFAVTAQQTYQDYLYQFDVYRSAYNEFKIAKNEYEKFKTLPSQQTALDKSKGMLTQRDQLLRAYLLMLNQKLIENTGLGESDRKLYQTLLTNEVTFLDSHSQLIPSIGSIDDAQNVSTQLETHYLILQSSIRQTITMLLLGQLTSLQKEYDVNISRAQGIVAQNAVLFGDQRLAILQRWLLQISNKRSLYQDKYNQIVSMNAQLKITDLNAMDKRFSEIQSAIQEAKQYLSEGNSYMKELVHAMKYQE